MPKTHIPVLNQSPEEVPLEKIVPFRTRGESTTPEKVALNEERISAEGILGYAVGRWLGADDKYAPGCFELFTFHNRRRACINLGYKTIPCVAVPTSWTDEQCFAKYLRDNSAVDGQSTNWAINAVEAGYTLLEASYRKNFSEGWEARLMKHLAGEMRQSVRDIMMLRNMGRALKAKTVASNIDRIIVVKSAIYVYNLFVRRQVSVPKQQGWLSELKTLKDSDDIERQCRDTFPKLPVAGLGKMKAPPIPKTMDDDIRKISNLMSDFVEKWKDDEDEAVSPKEESFFYKCDSAMKAVIDGGGDADVETPTEDRGRIIERGSEAAD